MLLQRKATYLKIVRQSNAQRAWQRAGDSTELEFRDKEFWLTPSHHENYANQGNPYISVKNQAALRICHDDSGSAMGQRGRLYGRIFIL
ncbi:hypothetical protein AB1K62_03810 [Parasphingorhabdus sp. JC815]|uniref:hypothetical protein n=1 Tax=Parasphingorhabdus sp. JC815 TaxID=3232140 RepID=UPI00345AEA91